MTLAVNFAVALVAIGIVAVSCRSISTTGAELQFGHNRHRDRDDFTKKFVCPALYGKYPHPQSCDHFFECRYGFATLMKCHRGYLYDEKKQQCRERRKVDCRRDGKDDKIPEEKEDKEFKCPSDWGTFAHPRDCSKYYVCIYKLVTVFQCPRGTNFDERARICMLKNLVDCGRRLDRDGTTSTTLRPEKTTRKITTTSVTTTKVPRRFFCPFPNGRYADPEDCSSYYDCRSFKPKWYQCGRSKLYDERKEECRDRQKVRCGDRTGPDGRKKEEKPYCPFTWGTFYHPTDCSKYMICLYNVPTVLTCRKDELFHAIFSRCMPKKTVACGKRTNPDELLPPGKTTALTTKTSISTTPRGCSTKARTKESTTTPIITTTTTEILTTTPESDTTKELLTTPEATTLGELTTRSKETTLDELTDVPEKSTSDEITSVSEKTTSNELTTVPEETTISEEITTTPKKSTTIEEQTVSITTSESTIEIVSTTISQTDGPITKPNTPPPTDCKEDDLECIIDGTGDVDGWFDCPQRYGHFPHGSSKQLFIHCDNWKPYIKKCAQNTEFSPEYLVCVWQH